MTILEAMCYGIPVIAPPVGGPAELVIDGENGYQVDVRNTDKLDHLIASLARHPNECGQLSRKAKATSTHFSSSLLKQKITEVIDAYN
jgi:glycosyltransferase involved in cell wall biosynthesis